MKMLRIPGFRYSGFRGFGTMRKRGTTEWTMAKLLTLVLGVFLLVIIIYGVQNKGFGPLVENIEGRANEALIFIGWRDDGIPKCGDAFPETIDGMSGDFYPCEDSCLFVLDGENSLLGFTNFSIKGDSITVSGDGVSDNDEAYRFGSAEAQRHKEAYDLLNDTVEEFLLSEDGKNWDEGGFVDVMSFGRGMTLVFEVDDWGGNTFYEYSGIGWRKGKLKDGEFKGKNIELKEVGDELWKAKNKQKDIVWNYNGDEKSNFLLSNFNKDFRNVMYSEGEYKIWFYDKMQNSKEVGKNFVIEVDDWGFNTFYFFRGGSWYVQGILKDKPLSTEDTFDRIFALHQKGLKIVWHWEDLFYGLGFTLVSNERILERGEYATEGGFKEWLKEKQDDWKGSLVDQDRLLVKLGVFLEDTNSFDFYGEEGRIEKTFMEKFKFPIIYFVSGEERFGLYYRGGVEKLFYNTDDSVVSDFVVRSDWDDFIKINKIYEEFKLRRCGNE